MRNVLLASVVALSAFLANGCVPLGCGAFEGGGNRVYERENDMLILCENGGFVATLDTSMLEGRFSEELPGSVTGMRGEDGQLAFELADHGDGTASAPQLGEGMWTAKAFDEVALDHSNVLCNDLQYRTWWVQQ